MGASRALPVALVLLAGSLAGVLVDDVQAQGPTETFFVLNMRASPPSVQLPYKGVASTTVTITDESIAQGVAITKPVAYPVNLRAEVIGNASGWTAGVSQAQLLSTPGQVHTVGLTVTNDGTATNTLVVVRVNATYVAQTGTRSFFLDVMATVTPAPFFVLTPRALPPRLHPHEIATIQFTVTNYDQYPDMVAFEITVPSGWEFIAPTPVVLFPFDTANVTFQVKARTDVLYTFGTSDSINVRAYSLNDPQAVRSISFPVGLTGSYIPPWFWPNLLFLMLGVVVLAGRGRRRAEERTYERGAPRFTGLPPQEDAALLVLAAADPPRHRARREQLRALYIRRRQEYRRASRDRRRAERDLAATEQEHHDELVAQQRSVQGESRQAEAERKRVEARAATADKRQAALAVAAAKKQQKKEARAAKAERKRLKAERKRLERERRREDRREAAIETREAKRKQIQLQRLERKKQRLEKQNKRRRRGGDEGPGE